MMPCSLIAAAMSAVAVDTEGNVYIADGSRVLELPAQ